MKLASATLRANPGPRPALATTNDGLIALADQERVSMKQEMLINVAQPEECRIAIVEDGQLEELYVERTSQDNYVGNIYKGKVVNIEPSIQAAFVDFGVGRNGFLHISDVEPQYYRQGGFDPTRPIESGPRSRHHDIDLGDDDPVDDESPEGEGVDDAGDEPGGEETEATPRPERRPRARPARDRA